MFVQAASMDDLSLRSYSLAITRLLLQSGIKQFMIIFSCFASGVCTEAAVSHSGRFGFFFFFLGGLFSVRLVRLQRRMHPLCRWTVRLWQRISFAVCGTRVCARGRTCLSKPVCAVFVARFFLSLASLLCYSSLYETNLRVCSLSFC